MQCVRAATNARNYRVGPRSFAVSPSPPIERVQPSVNIILVSGLVGVSFTRVSTSTSGEMETTPEPRNSDISEEMQGRTIARLRTRRVSIDCVN